MLESRSKHHEQGQDKYVVPLASYSMTTRDYIVRPDATAGAMTITLPPVGECKGRFYSIFAYFANNTNTITIRPFTSTGFAGGDAEGWAGNLVLNEMGRGATFYSDGRKWQFGDKHFTSSLIAGAVNLDEVHLTMDTAGAATVDAMIVRLESAVMLGNSAGAIFAQVNYDAAAAGVSGLSYAIGAEMILPNIAGIPSGHYTCLDFELSAGNVCTWGGGTKVSYMRFATWGTQTSIDDTAFWFTLAATDLVDHLVSLNAQTIRCQIESLTAGINKTRFVVLSIAQNILDHATTVVSGSYGMRSVGTLDAGASDGVAAYFEGHTTLAAGNNFAVGAWMNIDSAPASGETRALDVGIYGVGVDLSGGALVVANFEFHADIANPPSAIYQMRFNNDGTKQPATAWFRATQGAAIAWTAGATDTATKTGDIAIVIGGTTHYIKTWDGMS